MQLIREHRGFMANQLSPNRTSKRILLSIASVALMAIYGCGGGDGGESTVAQPSLTGSGSTGVQTSPTPTITFKGVVATGAPGGGAEVSIEGDDTVAIAKDDGSYEITVPALLKPPYIFNANFFRSGVPKQLKSIVMEEGGGVKKIANITPVTDMITSALLDYHNREFPGEGGRKRELPVNLGLLKTVTEVGKGVLRDLGCGSYCAAESYNPITSEFGPADPTQNIVDRAYENFKASYSNGVAVITDRIGNNLALLPLAKLISGEARTADAEVITPAERELAIVRRGPITVVSLDGDSCRMSGTLTRGEILNKVCIPLKTVCARPLVAVNGTCVSPGQDVQAEYEKCYVGTPDLYTATYCEAYARARASGSTATGANEVGAAAAGGNVGNIDTGQAISSTGTRGPFTGTLSKAQTAFNECYDGTPDLYSSVYCTAYARARASGNSATAANAAGAAAAGSNVGNIGSGQAISSVGTSPSSTSASSGTTTTTRNCPIGFALTSNGLCGARTSTGSSGSTSLDYSKTDYSASTTASRFGTGQSRGGSGCPPPPATTCPK